MFVTMEWIKSEDELESGLIVLWEMLENQAPFLEGREATIFDALLQIRYSDYTNVSTFLRINAVCKTTNATCSGKGAPSDELIPGCSDNSHRTSLRLDYPPCQLEGIP